MGENVESLEEFVRNFEQEYNQNQGRLDLDRDLGTDSEIMANQNEKEETEILLREYCSELEEKVKKLQGAENLSKQDLRRKDKKNLELYQENRAYVEKINELVAEQDKISENIKLLKKGHKDTMVIREQEIRKEVAKLWEERCQIKNEIKSKFLERLVNHESTLDTLTEEMEELCFMMNQISNQNISIMYESNSSIDAESIQASEFNLNSRNSLNKNSKQKVTGEDGKTTNRESVVLKRSKFLCKVKVVCNNCAKFESTIVEMVQNLEDSNTTILRL